jgi:hypothetical protein
MLSASLRRLHGRDEVPRRDELSDQVVFLVTHARQRDLARRATAQAGQLNIDVVQRRALNLLDGAPVAQARV